MARHYTSTFNTRQDMQRRDMEVFYYEDRLLHPVSSHCHEHYEIYFFISGSVSCRIGERTYPLSYGDLCLMPPGIYHQPIFHDPADTYRRIVLWITPEYMQILRASFPNIDFCFQFACQNHRYHFVNDSGTAQILFGKLFDLLEEYHTASALHESMLACYVSSFLLNLNRSLQSRPYSSCSREPKPLFSQICDYIHTHLGEKLTLDILAEQFFVSKYHIAHIFKENMGISTHQYILHSRLHASKGNILSGMPLQEVGRYYGFSNYTTFFRAFKKEFGISPRAFKDTCKIDSHSNPV